MTQACRIAMWGTEAGIGWVSLIGVALVVVGLILLVLVDAPRRFFAFLVHLGNRARRRSPERERHHQQQTQVSDPPQPAGLWVTMPPPSPPGTAPTEEDARDSGRDGQ